MIRFILMLLQPGFWLDLWNLRKEDDSLDLTDQPESAAYAAAQAKEYKAWRIRQRKKGRVV
jgi:hypothetical protein